MLAPTINGILQGSLVELTGIDSTSADGTVSPELNLERGQLVDYAGGQFVVALLRTGRSVTVDPRHVRACESLARPGEGGDSNSFDLVLGPRTRSDVFGEEVASCLTEKGFCVVRVLLHETERDQATEALQRAEAACNFGRLAAQVEEGYLGRSGRAKVMWLDPDSPALADDGLVWAVDGNITRVAEILQPYCADAVGSPVEDRTAALVCMSMSDADEERYTQLDADDVQLAEYYTTWSRSVLRVVQYLGPATGTAVLQPKAAAPLSGLPRELEISAVPGTMLIVREDTFHYCFDEPLDGEVNWMQAFLMKPKPEWSLETLHTDGLMDVFSRADLDGPPKPAADVVSVVALAIQAAGNMGSTAKEWNAYIAGTDAQLEMPIKRFEYATYYEDEFDAPKPWCAYVKHFSVQEGIEMFDNKAFEISTSEAAAMDPQIRQVLEVGYIALSQLGITKKMMNQKPAHASVSVGCDKNEWVHMDDAPSSVATNNQLAINANRFSYVFNLKGGSYVCDTACSSSLIALHLGKVNLLEKRWDPLEYHLGVGVNLTLTYWSFVGSSQSHMLSPSGRCLTFNATANGYNRGDGNSGIIIKAGDLEERLCYLRGSQIGNDGRSASMSAPNGPAQEKCIWGAVREARMTCPESTVWECHGTGTSLGDPIEVGAVRKVQIKAPRLEPLMISTSKSNLGHLEGGAAGVAMIKCCMVVRKTKSAPTIHLKTLNPHLEHTQFDAFFSTECTPYKYNQGHCQVSSFGVGGTNGHAVFWGEESYAAKTVDPEKLFMKKLEVQPPKIIADGPDPEDWNYSGPAGVLKPGEAYRVRIDRDPVTGATPIRWEKYTLEEEPRPEFYSMTGSYNEWVAERMEEGEVPGLWYQIVDIPDSGTMEFRFLEDDDTNRALGPLEKSCKRRLAPAEASKSCETSWVIDGQPGEVYRVELLVPSKRPPAVTWFKMR